MPSSIILDRVKENINVGIVLRAAYNFKVDSIYIIGNRYKRSSTDTPNTTKYIPTLHFDTWEDYKKTKNPWPHIGVELTEDSKEITNFVHPKSAVYILGPEDGSLCNSAKEICATMIKIPTQHCLNLGVCTAVVLYDRLLKNSGDFSKC